MATRELPHDEAIRRLLSYTKPESPSEDFTSRLMERISAEPEPAQSWLISYQWLVLLTAISGGVLLLFFPIWSWFGLEFTPGQFILYYAREGFSIAALWLGETLSKLGSMGKMMYLIPVSFAILLLVSVDQAIKRPTHEVKHAL